MRLLWTQLIVLVALTLAAMYTAPCCIGLRLLYLSRLPICSFYAILEMSSIKIKFSPAWHSTIGLHEVFLPLPWSQYRVSVLVMLYQLSFTRGASLARCSGVSHDVLVVTARAYYVSPLVRRSFLHQSILFSFVSPLSAGRFSINLGYQSYIERSFVKMKSSYFQTSQQRQACTCSSSLHLNSK